MNVTTLTYKIAYEIASDRFGLERFYKEANCNHVMMFTHTRHIYTFPAFGKKWPEDKNCQFHKVDTFCHLCKCPPASEGYVTLWLLHNGISDKTIVERSGKGKDRKYIELENKFTRFILLCDDCIGSYFKWDSCKYESIPAKSKVFEPVQLELFV
jgi:hypothetical protein